MNPHDKQKTILRYNKRLETFGHDAQTLGWGGGRTRQDVRFKTLLDIGLFLDSPIHSVLDVGCGFADLYDYLRSKQLPIEYRGVDINDTLLDTARDAYPNVDVLCLDILDDATLGASDIVVESGIFNYRLTGQDQWDYIEQMLRRMYALSNLGVAADFMTSYVDWEKDGAFHTNPEKLLGIAKSIANRVILRHDYLPYEFCLYMMR